MRIPHSLRLLCGVAFAALLVATAALTRAQWKQWLLPAPTASTAAAVAASPITEPKVLKLSPQARKNLGLVAKAAKPQTYWRTIQVPGEIVDRPGRSDRGVTAPAVGVVTRVHAFPGDTVRPGDRLFTLRLSSEYLQNTQSELFRVTRDVELIKEQKSRLEKGSLSGAIPGTRLIELDAQLRRQAAAIQSHRQDLLTRGLTPAQITGVEEGTFVSTIDVVAPPLTEMVSSPEDVPSAEPQLIDARDDGPVYEIQELSVNLGQQVQAGQLLSMLANHHALYIEGHAFKQEASVLERAAQKGWIVRVEFAEDDREHWPELRQAFRIHHLANTIDAGSRTFDFYLPLVNQSRGYERDGQSFVVWRFRPGQRVRLYVPVEELTDVLVVPAAGVVREGPEAYVFRQNGDLFNRLPVHIVHEDRLNIVLANDGSITPGLYLAQNAAASLNRVLKAQAASGVRADVHVHADGTVHAAH